MIFLSKLVYAMFTPPGLFIVVILIMAVWLIRRHTHKLLSIALLLLALFMYITSIPIFAAGINDALDHTYQRQLPPENADAAVVVLAGGVSEDENGHPFQPSIETMERLYAAVKLSKEQPSCKFLIMSGCDAYDDTVTPVAVVMQEAAKVMDCHAEIIIEDKSRNTDENLKYSSEIVKNLGIKHVVIVTNNFHMARAMNFARQYIPKGIKIYSYPSGGYCPKRGVTSDDFLPNLKALSASCIGIKELLGNIVAKLR